MNTNTCRYCTMEFTENETPAVEKETHDGQAFALCSRHADATFGDEPEVKEAEARERERERKIQEAQQAELAEQELQVKLEAERVAAADQERRAKFEAEVSE